MMKSSSARSAENLRKSPSASTDKMEAIACGVRARFEETMGYDKRVTDETVNIARTLGVPNSEIER